MISSEIYLSYLRCPRRSFLIMNYPIKKENNELLKMIYSLSDYKPMVFTKDDLTAKADLYIDGYCYLVKMSVKMSKSFKEELDFLSYVSDKPVRIVLINKKYCLNGKLDLKKLLYYLDYEPKDKKFISDKLALIRKLDTEPSLFMNCHNPNECYFLEHCYKEEKENSLLYLHSFPKKYQYYNNGYKTIDDLYHSELFNSLPLIVKKQIDYVVNNRPIYIDKEKISLFLDKIKEPIYFLDFECISDAIPSFKGVKPFEKVPFLYSLHILKNNELTHSGYIMKPGCDERLEMAQSLFNRIKEIGTIIAYNSSVEREMISALSKYEPQLKKVLGWFCDLEIPFRNNYLYDKDFKGSNSIKTIYDVLIKDEYNYHNLECNNGRIAMELYRNIDSFDSKGINDLVEYCSLDTYACYRIYMYLKNIVK